MTIFGLAFYKSYLTTENTHLNEFISGQIVVPEVVFNLSDDFLLKRRGGGIIAAAAIRHRRLVLCIDHFVHLLYRRRSGNGINIKIIKNLKYIRSFVGVCSASDPDSIRSVDPYPD
jgi:hypothetical protein